MHENAYSLSALCAFLLIACALVALALCVKCRRIEKGTVQYMATSVTSTLKKGIKFICASELNCKQRGKLMQGNHTLKNLCVIQAKYTLMQAYSLKSHCEEQKEFSIVFQIETLLSRGIRISIWNVYLLWHPM